MTDFMHVDDPRLRVTIGIARDDNDIAGLLELRQRIVRYPNVDPANTGLLVMVADKGSPQMVRALLDAGEGVHARYKGGLTASMQAAGSGNVGALEALLNAGARVDDVSDNGQSALLYACCSGTDPRAVVALLLQHDADVHVRNRWDEQALHLCCRSYSWNGDVARSLMDAGADPCSVAKGTDSVLHRAVNSQANDHRPSPDVALAVLERGATFDAHRLPAQLDDAWQAAVRKDHPGLLRWLHQYHADAREHRLSGDPGKTLLHLAFEVDSPQAALALLDLGVDPSIKDRRGYKPMSHAYRAPRCAQVLQSFLRTFQARKALEALSQPETPCP